nr:NUDIX domain-containing protein [Pseudomonas sp.]
MLEALMERASLPPPVQSLRVYVGERPCGWASPQAAQALRHAFPSYEKNKEFKLPADADILADVAVALREAGALNGWRNELLDIICETGTTVSRIERAVMRPLGLATQSVHLNAFTPDGNMWIAQRSPHKSTDPGMWDTLVGGLIASGETPALALLRESHEEAGLLPSDLVRRREIGRFVVSRQVPEGYQVEAVTVTDCVLDAACQPVNQDGEVALIRTAHPAEALDMIQAGLFTTEAALSILLSMKQAATGEHIQGRVVVG